MLHATEGTSLFIAWYGGHDGGHIQSHAYPSPGNQIPKAAALDGDGNVIVVGYTTGAIDFGGGERSVEGSSENTFVAKFSPVGGHMWSDVYGGNERDRARAVVVDDGGNVYVAGSFRLGMTLGATPTLVSKGNDDAFIAKLAP